MAQIIKLPKPKLEVADILRNIWATIETPIPYGRINTKSYLTF